MVDKKALKNKISDAGGLVCGGFGNKGCGKDAGIGQLIRGVVFCAKCYKEIKGVKK